MCFGVAGVSVWLAGVSVWPLVCAPPSGFRFSLGGRIAEARGGGVGVLGATAWDGMCGIGAGGWVDWRVYT